MSQVPHIRIVHEFEPASITIGQIVDLKVTKSVIHVEGGIINIEHDGRTSMLSPGSTFTMNYDARVRLVRE